MSSDRMLPQIRAGRGTMLAGTTTGIRQGLEAAHMVIADDVVRHILTLDAAVDWADLPCVMPPFPSTWVEGRYDAFYDPDDNKVVAAPGGGALGWLVNVSDAGPMIDELVRRDWGREETAHEARVFAQRCMFGGARWLMTVNSWGLGRGDAPYGPLYCHVLALDAQGAPGKCNAGILEFKYDHTLAAHDQPHIIDSALYALALMHCRNVTVTEVETNPKVERARAKRGAPAGIRYSVVTVDALRAAVQARRGDRRGDAGRRALHMVRSHFKSYTPDRPLLGKHTGRYFWPVFMRGDARAGRVESTHVVTHREG